MGRNDDADDDDDDDAGEIPSDQPRKASRNSGADAGRFMMT